MMLTDTGFEESDFTEHAEPAFFFFDMIMPIRNNDNVTLPSWVLHRKATFLHVTTELKSNKCCFSSLKIRSGMYHFKRVWDMFQEMALMSMPQVI